MWRDRENNMNFEAAPKSAVIEANYDDARFYCIGNIDDKTGWRLPTKDELNQLYNSSNGYGPEWYWTSTPYVVPHNPRFDNAVWVQNFRIGLQTYCLTDHNIPFEKYYVLPVRDLKAN